VFSRLSPHRSQLEVEATEIRYLLDLVLDLGPEFRRYRSAVVWFLTVLVRRFGVLLDKTAKAVVATSAAGGGFGGFGLPLVLTRSGAALLVVAASGAVVVLVTGGVVVAAALGALFRRLVGA